jgi:hypothetical protein
MQGHGGAAVFKVSGEVIPSLEKRIEFGMDTRPLSQVALCIKPTKKETAQYLFLT